MTTRRVTLNQRASRGLAELRRTVKDQARGKAVELRLPAGAHPVEADEVMIVVLGSTGAIAGTRKLRKKPMKARDLWLWLASTEAAIAELSDAPGAKSAQLSAAEASLLDQAGFTAGDDEEPGSLERSRIEFELLLRRDSLTLAEAAKVLGVSASRLRQRLSPSNRTLYGIKDQGAWRIPRFQFARKNQLVRGIDRVLPRIRQDAHPLAVKKWFTTPHQDLVLGEQERRVAPLAWLAAGQSPEAVAGLAEEV